jgi:RNA polymerase sigma-70 factor (ECF subfamily)
MEPSDEELIRRFRQGDERAFEDLAQRWDPAILRLAYRLTGDLEEARDVRQMTLVKTYRALPAFNGHARPTTWLYRVVLNLCRDRHRRRAARGRALDAAARRAGAEVDGGAGAGETAPGIERGEVARRVAEAVATLPEREREVVVLRHYHDLPLAGIAELVGAPLPTVKSRMLRGMEHLRARLKDLST